MTGGGKPGSARTATPPRRRRLPRPGGRVSLVIALLLVGSVLVRLADGTGAAIAREIAALGASGPEGVAGLEFAGCVSGPDVAAMLDDLAGQRETLSARQAALDLRESDLAAAAQVVEAKLAELAAAEDGLRAMIAMAETASENDVGQLVAVYENMKPKDAAAVFEQMAPQFAAGFLARMRPDSAARILAGLQPATAYAVSAHLAGRNATVPSQ